MQTPALSTQRGGNGLGYVAETLPNGARLVTHSGDFPGWRGQYLALPDRSAGIVVLANSNAGGRYVVADTLCHWADWAAGAQPGACQAYRIVYIAIPLLAGVGGLAVLASIWRTVTQLRTGQRRLAWPPQTDRQRRDIVFAPVALAGWWLVVTPRLGLLLPPTFNWVTLAFTLWCLAAAAKSLTSVTDRPKQRARAAAR